MLRTGRPALRDRAEAMLRELDGLPLEGRVREVMSRVGGGTLPRAELPSAAVELRLMEGTGLSEFAARLRQAETPVVGYVSEGRYRMDLRTVFPEQDAAIVRAIRWALDGDRKRR